MNEQDKAETVRRYSERLKLFGYSEEALGWSRNKNDVRFDALSREWFPELETAAIADFGCGFGDFYGYLKARGLSDFKYTGIDINASLVEVGRNTYPDASFWVGDVVNEPYSETFDFIFSSGVFNHKLQHTDEYTFIAETLTKLNALSTKGFAVNFLSDKVDFQHGHTFHSNPGRILEIVYGFSRNVVLRNDYMPFEFTVYVRKDRAIDPDKVIFQGF